MGEGRILKIARKNEWLLVTMLIPPCFYISGATSILSGKKTIESEDGHLTIEPDPQEAPAWKVGMMINAGF